MFDWPNIVGGKEPSRSELEVLPNGGVEVTLVYHLPAIHLTKKESTPPQWQIVPGPSVPILDIRGFLLDPEIAMLWLGLLAAGAWWLCWS